MSKVRNRHPLLPHLEISPLSHVLNFEYIIRDYLQTRLVILPGRLDCTAHPEGAREFSPWHDSWAYFHHGSGKGRGGEGERGTQENPFPTNVQFSCWRLVERIERGYPFPASRPGPQLVLPWSVFLSSLMSRACRSIDQKSLWKLLSDRLVERVIG